MSKALKEKVEMLEALLTAMMKAESNKKLVVWNTNPPDSTPIVICYEWNPDPFGGPAIMDRKIMIGPGQAVDLGILGLSLQKPKARGDNE